MSPHIDPDHARATRRDADRLADLVVLKAHGTGNDFVVLVDPDDTVVDLAADTVVALCDRHLGIGADGVIRVGGPPAPGDFGDVEVDGAQVAMDYRNGDGTIVEMCGNGIRVTARIAVEHGLVGPDAEQVAVATRSGVRVVDLHRGDGVVTGATVDMGPASIVAGHVGLDPDADTADLVLEGVPDRHWSAISMGNPHVVGTVDDLDAVDLATLGPKVETHDAFAAGTNVNLVEVGPDAHVRLRTWERGVGETMACGSGTCAAVAALADRGLVDPDGGPVEVDVAGGHLVVRRDQRGHLLMTGPAEVVARIDLDPAWLARLR